MQNRLSYFSLLLLLLTFGGKVAGQTDSISTCKIIPKIHLDSFIHNYQRNPWNRLRASVEIVPKRWTHFTIGTEVSRNFWDKGTYKGDRLAVFRLSRAHSFGLFGRYYPGWFPLKKGQRFSGFYGQVKCWYEWQRWWYPSSRGLIREYHEQAWIGDLSLGYQFRLGRSVVIDPSATIGYGVRKYMHVGWDRTFYFDASLRLGWVIPVKK